MNMYLQKEPEVAGRSTFELTFWRPRFKYETNVIIMIQQQNSLYTLSGRIGKVVASHAEGCKIESRAVAELHRFILCTIRSGGAAHEGGGCDQSVGSTDSDAIVRSWLWSTATRSSPLGYFSR